MPSNWIKNYLGNYELTVWQGPFDKNQLRQDGNMRSMYYWLYTQGKKYLQIYQADENSFMARLDVKVEGSQAIIIEPEFKEEYENHISVNTTKSYWFQVHGLAGDGIHGFLSDGEVKIQFVMLPLNQGVSIHIRSAIDHQRAYNQNEIVVLSFKYLKTQANKETEYIEQQHIDFDRSLSFHYPKGWKIDQTDGFLKIIPLHGFGDNHIFVHTAPANGHTQIDHPNVIAYFEGLMQKDVNPTLVPPKQIGKPYEVEAFGKKGLLLHWDQQAKDRFRLITRVRIFSVIHNDYLISLWVQGRDEDAKKRDKIFTKIFSTFKGKGPAANQKTNPQTTQTHSQANYQTTNQYDTHQRQQCGYCSGSGMVTCSSCYGMGYHNSSYTRTNWDGSVEYVNEQIPCGCSGGRSVCSACGGSGMK